MDPSTNPRHNQLLAALPKEQWQRWLPHLEHVTMPLAQVLYEPGGTLSHVYFPTTAIVSLLYVMQNGESAEIAVVGNDGVVGVSLFMGGDSTSSRALVQSAGGAFRLTGRLMKEEFDRSGPVLHLFLRYSGAGPRRAGEAHLRVLCGGQEGIRQIAASQIGGLAQVSAPPQPPPGRPPI